MSNETSWDPTTKHGREMIGLPAAPDMDRMGDKYIKPCRGCGELLLWAKHETTGKVAPLVKAKEGEKPNIVARFENDQWIYKIKGTKSEAMRGAAEYVNHFSNCPKSQDFKPHAWKDASTR